MGFAKLSLKGRALKLLSQREHSRLELWRKLAGHVEEGDDLNAVLDDLEKRGFINEERVVESVIHSKASRFGAARLVQELRGKGLDDEMVRLAGDQLRDTELLRARELWRKRFGVPPADLKEKAKQLRFMAARGFSSAVASRVVREAPYSEADFDESDHAD
ncbi:recombination regulator RecX [Comamonas resistens]|uniref:Regulatory protein RecX n=1 Tax=Comamonas resistens TaxID=3046670 RepID=A0ABY8SR75_9BURK|nr:recombination regulator RecX [Comamonas resistens]MDL5037432.1 recombination regulator RecX [Comamonas resistens]WHS65562.1 recombination regulator RecX [Comamonas resistens]